MAQEKQRPKLERNLCIRFRDNCDTDRRTMDKLQFHELCWNIQAELKIKKKKKKERNGLEMWLTKCLSPKFGLMCLASEKTI